MDDEIQANIGIPLVEKTRMADILKTTTLLTQHVVPS